MIRVADLTPDRIADLEDLFGSDEVTDRCWCMWFIIRVRDFHDAGREGNRSGFIDLASGEPTPMGLIAYEGDDPVGWCAAGPRRRYERMLASPTLKGRDQGEDDSVWLVPCFYIRGDARGEGVATALLAGAVDLARRHGAVAIEGFPLSGDGRRSGGDLQVGIEPLFASCGFEPVRRPSENRVIMRRALD